MAKTTKLRPWTKDDVRLLKSLAQEKTKTTAIARRAHGVEKIGGGYISQCAAMYASRRTFDSVSKSSNRCLTTSPMLTMPTSLPLATGKCRTR
jgi:hypothetical protein